MVNQARFQSKELQDIELLFMVIIANTLALSCKPLGSVKWKVQA